MQKSRDSQALRPSKDPGMAFALELYVMRWLTMAALLTSMSCLVTEKAQVERQGNLPPSVLAVSPPFDAIVQVDLADSELGSEVSFEVEVRDPNLSQELKLQAYLNYEGTPSTSLIELDSNVLMPATDEEGAFTLMRTYRLNVPVARLTAPNCHKVELLVSAQFQRGPTEFRFPEEEGDLAHAVWWLRVVDNDAPGEPIELSECK